MDTTQTKPNRCSKTNHRISILNTQIDVLMMQQAVDLTEEYILSKRPLHIVGLNADKINQMYQDKAFKQIVNGCGLIHADGASVVLASRFLKHPLPERIAGIDLMERLTALSEEKGYGIYLLGARQHVVERTHSALQRSFPDLHIRGIHNGYFEEADWPQISQELKEAAADIVFVGISSPNKERLISWLQEEGHDCVFMGVGGSFDILSGEKSRAPVWVRKSGMEWLFRMLQEPQRLMKRYLVGNCVFINTVVKEKIGLLRHKK